ncbi:MAG: nicotinate-nucleotide adenylyltransferase [Burkholderiales bacterium]|nr:nicotinate-nucleotide adenylyltransferase [Burkholderiales bacterium]MDP2399800.1 nicotinate-nucleotide adenylyltransferase [Burkholderiales bacterium]
MSPIGILGGTFDPIHFGHLRLAQEVADQLRLAEVRFIPSGTPPHRAAPGTLAADRLAMVRLAVAGNALFTVDPRESSSTAPGYTVDTLTALRSEVGAAQSLVMILGADAFLDLATWSRWHQLFELAHVAVAYRPGFPVDTWQSRMPQPLAAEYNARLLHQPFSVHVAPAGGIVVVPIAELNISATMIRDSLRQGKNPRYLLPDSIYQYIQEHMLYSEN